MGMSINEQIKGLEYLKKCGIFPFTDTRTGIIFTDECINEVIETLRKYQQIEQIVKQYKKFGNIDFSMQIISGVVNNGNDD